MSFAEFIQTMQGVGAIGGLVFAFLAYWKGRGNQKAIASAAVEMTGAKAAILQTASKVAETHDLVNGQSEILRTAAYAKGVKDEKTDARNVTELARNLAADAAVTKKENGG